MRLCRGTALLVLAAGFAATAPATAQSLAARHDREVLTRDDLQAAGINRLTDLIAWLGTSAGTVEGLAWILSIDELPPTQLIGGGLADVAIFIDGQPVSIDAQHATYPELLPIALQQVDSVEVIRTATLIGGTFAERGALHFHTSTLPRGISVRSWARHGAETGDPGPYRYTDRSTPNVQRSGPDGVGVVGIGGRGWEVEISGRYLETAVDDSLVWAIHGESPFFSAYARGGGLRVAVDAMSGRHQLLVARHNQLGDSWLPMIGDVGNSRIEQQHVGLSGALATGGFGVRYRLTDSRMVSRIPGSLPAFERARTEAAVEASREAGAWQVMGGIGIERMAVDTEPPAGAAPRVSRTAPGLHARIGHASPRRREELFLSFRAAGGDIAERLAGSIAWQLGDDRSVIIGATYASPLPAEPAGLAWSLSFPAEIPQEHQLVRGSLTVNQNLGSRLALQLGGLAGSLARRPVSGGTDPTGSVSQHFQGIEAGVRTTGAGMFQGRLLYRATRTSGRIGQGIPTSPRHHLTGLLTYRPNPSFRLGAATLLKSSPGWPVESYPDAAPAELEPISRVTISAEKWLWEGRIRTQLAVSNLLDTPERHHPAGGDFGLNYFVGVALELPQRGNP